MNDIARNLWRQLIADKKKLFLMLGLGCVGLLLWGRLLLRNVPRTATADPATHGQSVDSASLDTRIMPPTLAEDMGTAQARAGSSMTVKLDAPNRLGRDLFNWDRGPYRQVKMADQPRKRPKPPKPRADRKFRVAQARQAGRDLNLESIIGGSEPAAIINGQVLHQGQRIESFTVHQIGRRSVVLQMNGILLRLRM